MTLWIGAPGQHRELRRHGQPGATRGRSASFEADACVLASPPRSP